MKVEIKRRHDQKETEQNVPMSQRTIWYEVYVDGEFIKSFDDVCDAMDFKEQFQQLD